VHHVLQYVVHSQLHPSKMQTSSPVLAVTGKRAR
jgi:hypothetical protein